MGPLGDDSLTGSLLQRCCFPGRDHHDVAVSGGADSVSLLVLATQTGARVTAHHVDHGLRPGGRSEAAFVARLAGRFGAVFRSHAVALGEGADLEGRAREARLAVLPPGTLTGHTADDQAETVLLRLIRGTGPAGLAAMDTTHHPLLGLRRRETEALCAHLGITPFVDPTNADARFTRNRVRHEVLPLLSDVAGRDVVPLVNRAADLLREQSEAVSDLAAGLDPADTAALRGVPQPLAREALRIWWRAETAGLPPPDRAAVHRMMDVVVGTNRACDVTGGWRLLRSSGRLRLVGPDPADDSGVDTR